MQDSDVKVDLHVHSCFSGPKTSWLLQLAGASECYTTPTKLYELATARGMDLVTICDHDEISGAVELRGMYDNVFISEEISAKFPDDDCIVHVIGLDIDEAKHREIQRLRYNIYELAAYLEAEKIGHVLCHPLAPVNRRLNEQHLKQCFFMFRGVEIRNGTRDATLEQQARRILGNLTPALLAQWAEEFPQAPFINREALYGLSGGSDDHAGLSIARAHTSFRGEVSGAGLVKALQSRTTTPLGDTATADVIAHNIYGVIGGVLKSTGQLPSADVGRSSPSPAMTQTLARFAMMAATSGMTLDFSSLATKGHTDEAQTQLHHLLEHVLVQTSREAVGELKNALLSAHLIEAADAVSGVLKAALLGTPAVAAMRSYALDRRSARALARPFAGEEPRAHPVRVAVLSDTVDETNGVALGLRRFIEHAHAAGLDGRLLGLGEGSHVVEEGGVVRIPSIMRHRLRDYPQINFGIPHLPSLMRYLVNEDIDLIQCSTPGPMGLAGLALGRMCGIPVIGQYHTDLPVYAQRITGDAVLADMCSSWVGWFYAALDQVLSPSASTRARLVTLGVPAEKIRLVPRGVDLELFTPQRRDSHAFSSMGLNGEPKVLYVGRISREKGLDSLVRGFAGISDAVPEARLLLVGDGPYASTLAASSSNDKVIFAGEHTGADLARLYASSDLFVFPSETETFGNAVVEAQAAGLPVVVASRGGAHENVVDGVTGLVVDAQNPEAIGRAIRDLLTHPRRLRSMSEAAARHAQRFNLRSAALGTFDIYRTFLGESGETESSRASA